MDNMIFYNFTSLKEIKDIIKYFDIKKWKTKGLITKDNIHEAFTYKEETILFVVYNLLSYGNNGRDLKNKSFEEMKKIIKKKFRGLGELCNISKFIDYRRLKMDTLKLILKENKNGL